MTFRQSIRSSLPYLAPTALSAFLMSPFSARGADFVRPSAEEAPIALAEEPEDDGFAGYLARRQVILGGGVIVQPEYEGADKFKIMPVPLVSFAFNESVIADPTGLQFTVFSRDELSFRLRGGYDGGRSEDDSDDLKGLGDIDAAADLSGTLAYRLGPVELTGTLQKFVGGSDGLQAIVGATYTRDVGRFLLSAGASATWADGDYMSDYFGVTAEQSAASGLARHDAGSGLKRVDAEVFVTYLMSEHWALRGQVGFGRLVGDAADSPIVQDKFQPSAMLMLGYRF